MIDSDFDDIVMSEIFVQDEVDCSSFSKPIYEPKRNLIFEDSIEFENFVHNDSFENLKEKVVVFPKARSTANQVFVTKGLDKSDTKHLTSIVKINNEIPRENRFWSKPIDYSDETIGLSG